MKSVCCGAVRESTVIEEKALSLDDLDQLIFLFYVHSELIVQKHAVEWIYDFTVLYFQQTCFFLFYTI